MRILISTVLSTKNKVGVTEYLIGLLRSLQTIESTHEFFIITTKENRHFFEITNVRFHEIVVNLFDVSKAMLRLQYLLFSKYRIPSLIKKHKIDILHEPCSWFVNKKINTIVTVHDIVEIKSSKYSILFNKIKQKMIYSSLQNANSIISVSNQTTNEIKNLEDRSIFTIYNGITKLKQKTEIEDILILDKYYLKANQYFIFVGSLLRHKNLLNLLKAFKAFCEFNIDYKLVLAGKEGNAITEIKNYISKNQMQKMIVLTGYFEEYEKYSLIKNAKALLLISKEEGFGFPVLEAQSVGVPVITSNRSSLKEISQDSAILIEPDSIDSILSAMHQVISKEFELDKLLQKGKLNVNRFSWQKSAEKTMDVYEKTYEQNNSSNN